MVTPPPQLPCGEGFEGYGVCCENKALEVGGEGPAGGVSAKLVLILLAETIASREEIPTSLLVHLPDVRLLAVGDGEEVLCHGQNLQRISSSVTPRRGWSGSP